MRGRARGTISRLVRLLAVGAWLTACAAQTTPSSRDGGPPPDGMRAVAHVVSNGWHTAIVVPRAEAAASGLLPEAAQFPDAAFLEFGWGDRDYYPARRATLGMTLRAALAPTPAIMHVAGRSRVPEPGDDREVARVALTGPGLHAMLRAIAQTFERQDGVPAEPVAPGLYPGSRFYHARGRFHLFNTCNTWTVRMLRAGGVEVSPAGVVTADQAMARLHAAIAAPRRVRRRRAARLRPMPLRSETCSRRRIPPRSARGRGPA